MQVVDNSRGPVRDPVAVDSDLPLRGHRPHAASIFLQSPAAGPRANESNFITPPPLSPRLEQQTKKTKRVSSEYYSGAFIMRSLLKVVVLCICLLAPGIICRIYTPDATILSVPIFYWAVAGAVSLLSYFAAIVLMTLVMWIVHQPRFIEYNLVYFASRMHKPVRRFLWFLGTYIGWRFLVVKQDENYTSESALWVLTQLLMCLLVYGIVMMFESLLVKLLATRIHRSAYFDRMQKSLAQQAQLKMLVEAARAYRNQMAAFGLEPTMSKLFKKLMNDGDDSNGGGSREGSSKDKEKEKEKERDGSDKLRSIEEINLEWTARHQQQQLPPQQQQQQNQQASQQHENIPQQESKEDEDRKQLLDAPSTSHSLPPLATSRDVFLDVDAVVPLSASHHSSSSSSLAPDAPSQPQSKNASASAWLPTAFTTDFSSLIKLFKRGASGVKRREMLIADDARSLAIQTAAYLKIFGDLEIYQQRFRKPRHLTLSLRARPNTAPSSSSASTSSINSSRSAKDKSSGGFHPHGLRQSPSETSFSTLLKSSMSSYPSTSSASPPLADLDKDAASQSPSPSPAPDKDADKNKVQDPSKCSDSTRIGKVVDQAHALFGLGRDASAGPNIVLLLKDFARVMPADKATQIFKLLDVTGNGEVDTKEMIKVFTDIQREKQALAFALDDTQTIVAKLDDVLRAVMWIILLFAFLFIFNVDVASILLSLTSLVVASAFAVGDSAKNLFNSVIFIFVTRPFDVGDRCNVEGMNYYVEKIDLMTTCLRHGARGVVIYPNSYLSTITIANYRRSGHLYHDFSVEVNFSTPAEQLQKLETMIRQYVAERPLDFYPDIAFNLIEMKAANMVVSIWVQQRSDFQDGALHFRNRSRLLWFIKQAMDHLGIQHTLPHQSIELTNIGEFGQVLKGGPGPLHKS